MHAYVAHRLQLSIRCCSLCVYFYRLFFYKRFSNELIDKDDHSVYQNVVQATHYIAVTKSQFYKLMYHSPRFNVECVYPLIFKKYEIVIRSEKSVLVPTNLSSIRPKNY